MANVRRNEKQQNVSHWDESAASTILVYNGMLGDPYYPAYFERHDKTMPKSDFVSELVIGKRDDISFLGYIDQLANLIGGQKAFRILDPYAFEEKMLRKHAQSCVDCSNVLLDLREGHGVFEPTDWVAAEKKLSAYVGDISADVASRLHRDALCSAAVMMLSRITPGSNLQRMGMIRVSEAAEVVNAALCGYDEIDISDMKDDPDGDWLPLGSKYAIRPKSSPKITRVSYQLENAYNAVSIWQTAIKACGCKSLQEYAGVESVWGMSATQIASIMRNFIVTSGVSAMIEALYDGVPLQDIVA